MDHDELVSLRRHPAWRLLAAETAPLILGFFHLVFIQPNARSHPQPALAAKLDGYLRHLRSIHGDDLYPRSAQDYLDDWSRGENAYLRRYYPEKGDEPEYDLTPAAEKALEWLRGLDRKPFVGTESRLLTLFQLLRTVAQAVETDPAARRAALERQKADVEMEIARLDAGEAGPAHDPTRVKESYFQIEESARRLLSDFRQVEENFRALDRRAREHIAVGREKKGRLLDRIFGEEDAITGSDEGRSFRAFWEFLMSPARQEELQALMEKLLALEEVRGLPPDDLLPRLKARLVEAGEKVKKTTASLAEHLRRFLDDQAWLENKRVMDLIRSIESQAVEARPSPPRSPDFTGLDDVRPALDLTMARGLYVPPKKTSLSEETVEEGAADFTPDALYELQYVDVDVLRDRVKTILRDRSQFALDELLERFPLERGLAELLAYLNLASRDAKTVFDESARREVFWTDAAGGTKRAEIPRVIFSR